MKIPLFNLHILREATFEAVIKDAALKALANQTKQMGLLLKENDLLAQGKPTKMELRFRRNRK